MASAASKCWRAARRSRWSTAWTPRWMWSWIVWAEAGTTAQTARTNARAVRRIENSRSWGSNCVEGNPIMVIPSLIERKRDGGTLTPAEWKALVDAYTAGSVPDYQMSALLMAVVWRGAAPPQPAPPPPPLPYSSGPPQLYRVGPPRGGQRPPRPAGG